MSAIRPLRDRLVVEKLDGHGRETVSPGGIIIPATAEKNIQTKRDYFRARVLAVGPDAARETCGELREGVDVLVMTYAADTDRIYTGKPTSHGLVIGLEDVLCAVEGS